MMKIKVKHRPKMNLPLLPRTLKVMTQLVLRYYAEKGKLSFWARYENCGTYTDHLFIIDTSRGDHINKIKFTEDKLGFSVTFTKTDPTTSSEEYVCLRFLSNTLEDSEELVSWVIHRYSILFKRKRKIPRGRIPKKILLVAGVCE